MRLPFTCAAVGFLLSVLSLAAQTTGGSQVSALVPPLVNFSGVLSDADGKPLTDVTGVTFALYAEQEGGTPIWVETQNIQPGKSGHYSVMLGSSTSQGLPVSLFSSGQARWLGVQPQGQEEQARVMLLSVPYALKAGDAQTLGGMPASAFVVAPKSSTASGAMPGSASGSAAGVSAAPDNSLPISGGGKTDYVPLWLSASKLGNSKLFQSSAGKVGIGTTTPVANLDVNGTVNAATGYSLGGKSFAFGSYSNANDFFGFAGNATTTGTDNLGSGYQALNANKTGSENTAAGYQSLVGNTTGGGNTATGYQSLVGNTTGSTNTAAGAAALATNTTGSYNTGVGVVALLYNVGGSNNTGVGYLAGPDVLSPNLTNATAIGANAVVSESNAVVLGGTGSNAVNVGIGTATPAYTLDVRGTGSFTGMVAINAITGPVTVSSGPLTIGSGDLALSKGNVDLPAAGGINLGGAPFAFAPLDPYGFQTNVFLGFAGNPANNPEEDTAVGIGALASDTGTVTLANTAMGWYALSTNNSGYNNTAFGQTALYSNSSGAYNTGVGVGALYSNTTGSNLTCIGFSCSASEDGLKNATAIGAHAVVGASNALVLGGTGQWAVKVGIGTATPSNILTIAQGAGHPVSDGWETFSSRRWKTNIQTLHGALGKVEQLRGVSYDLKANGKHEVGVIAEEVGAVVPEVVSYEENGKDARGVDYSRLTALLIEAAKEQQRQIQQGQAQLSKALRQIKQQQRLLRAQSSAMRSLEAEVREDRETLRKVKAQVAAAQPALVAVK
jgi:hypothetical protein